MQKYICEFLLIEIHENSSFLSFCLYHQIIYIYYINLTYINISSYLHATPLLSLFFLQTLFNKDVNGVMIHQHHCYLVHLCVQYMDINLVLKCISYNNILCLFLVSCVLLLLLLFFNWLFWILHGEEHQNILYIYNVNLTYIYSLFLLFFMDLLFSSFFFLYFFSSSFFFLLTKK